MAVIQVREDKIAGGSHPLGAKETLERMLRIALVGTIEEQVLGTARTIHVDGRTGQGQHGDRCFTQWQ